MSTQSDAQVLVVAHKTAATPALLEAIRERAEFGPAHSHLLFPNRTTPAGGRRNRPIRTSARAGRWWPSRLR